ncbi:MAG TPA: glycosyltransferase [Candidatus Andersenbacteria bacterium]|nr:glycosyltransferase [Candidatus Andersenbacteria bacterium]
MRIDAVSIRYVIAGLVVVTIDYTLFNILLTLGVGLVQATSMSFFAGTVTGYLLHGIWTFKYNSKGLHSIKFSQFFITGVVGLLITDIIVYTLTTFLHFNHNLSKSFAVIVAVIWAYSASRWWVFKKTTNTGEAKKATQKGMLVMSPYYPPHMGGLESHAYEFNEHMAQRGWNITVWTSNIPNGSPREELSPSGVRVYRYDAVEIITGFPIPAIWKRSFWKQWRIIRTFSYSHVVSRTRFFVSSLIAHIIANQIQTSHVHIEHGSYFVSQKSTFVNTIAYIYDVTIGRFILQSAQIVIANSQATAAFITSITHNKTRAHIIYRGVEYSDIAKIPAQDEIKKVYPSKIIVTFVGRLISGKGVHDLLASIAMCKSKDIIMCWIIGDGPSRKTLEALMRTLSLQGTVRFFGECSREKTISLIKASDIIVNPSYTEGMPTAIIEAALCGKAIIATNVGGTSEVVTGNVSALLVDPKEIKSLASAIDSFVQNSTMRKGYGDAAHTETMQKFLWEKSIKAYEHILLPTAH